MAKIDETILKKSAVLSPDGLFRYSLARWWTGEDMIPEHHVTWIMLNPSTADDEIDDPTIRRCMAYSIAWGYQGMTVGNLYAYRTPDPHALFKAQYPIGEDNDRWLGILGASAHMIVCAWGVHAQQYRSEQVRKFLQQFGATYALKLTKDGFPSHQLYLKGDLVPQPWIG